MKYITWNQFKKLTEHFTVYIPQGYIYFQYADCFSIVLSEDDEPLVTKDHENINENVHISQYYEYLLTKQNNKKIGIDPINNSLKLVICGGHTQFEIKAFLTKTLTTDEIIEALKKEKKNE